MTWLPIGQDSLVYGSPDGGKTVKADPEVEKRLARV